MGNIFSFLCSTKYFYVKQRKYKLIKLIGEGGFSFVYKVQDDNSGKTYALKKTLCQTPEQLKAARQEIDIFTKFKHPNLLQVIDYEIKPGKISGSSEVFSVLPLFLQGTLQDALEVRRVHQNAISGTTKDMFSESFVLSSFLELCYAMREFHDHNPPLSHNDIKPANILISNEKKLVLFDFGSVKPARHLITSRKEALDLQEWAVSHCTPLFKAPELFDVSSDAIIDERTDIWALGCTLYAMAYIESPFEADSISGSVALAVTSGNIRFPQNNKRYSKEFQDLVTWMLTLDPQQRPFINDVISRIETLLDASRVVIDVPPSPPSPNHVQSVPPPKNLVVTG